ncbi:MAG: HEAT repeat domain-containing protein [Methyloglobulus sp.]|nr:HEAT repeat domain-containing protein [Methyloglobulus sp.]
MEVSQASVFALSLVFASLLLLVAANVLANTDNVSNALQTGQPSSIQITLSKQTDSAILLETRSAPLVQILKAVADKTGVNIHYSVLPEAPVTATCVGANVGQVMDCLVAKQVGLVAHKPQKDKPAEFWLLGSSVGSCQAVTVAASAPLIAAAVQQPTPEEQALADQALQEQTGHLLKQTQSKDPNQRAEGIGNLGAVGPKDDPAVDEALRTAMNDKNADVRAQAIRAIVQRGGEEVANQVGLALKDNDVNVRLTAVSDIQDDETLLQQALNDSDQSVRDLAKDKLQDLAFRQSKGKQ